MRVTADDTLDQHASARDTPDRLSKYQLGQEADQIAEMTYFHRNANFVVCPDVSTSLSCNSFKEHRGIER
ncbi:hypothetical protein B2M20_16520 [Nitrobacter vulgaris]|uniref:Uncharacterized protein n=1 Tax=Nitrobacter vulgaris TaxID=29421 RepID=A0A1V4HV27_NITVU|nr:hypothetical protein B2M20_16520 [Nitrobacter vulgaris]